MQFRFQTRAIPLGLLLLGGALMLGIAFVANAQTLRIGGSGAGLSTARLLGEAFIKADGAQMTTAVVTDLGSSGGLRAIEDGALDIALVSRPLTAEETAAGLVGFEYGRSPFAFVTSKEGVKNITPAAIADFLSGRAVAWPDGQTVRMVLRPAADGDHAFLASLSPEIAAALSVAHKLPGMVVAVTDQDAADEAARLPGSLAANTLAVVLSEARPLNVLALNGVKPSATALALGLYPYFKPCIMVTRGTPGGAARRFIEFARSPRGRAILEANGHHVMH